ncbi:MAG TPA: phosphodiester glycosidase family protein [Caulobacteraceae bacterium]|nr:phosphodiester glycosidase family protein [Caulobacteraceae bacterium]
MPSRRTLVLGALSAGLEPALGAARSACRVEPFEGDRFVVCPYDPQTDDLRLAWRGPGGAPLGSLKALEASLGADARRVRFAMNAGMYDPARRPVGLFVAEGRTLRPLDRHDGAGNFYLKPNGVFWTGADGAPHVTKTEAFATSAAEPRWATQSGPLLVRDGRLHPRISANGTSLAVRNAVGVKPGEALFVISQGKVSFGRLARFLRDGLGCPDALYLDGSVSSLWAPGLRRQDRRQDLGTFVVVLERGPVA